MAVLLIFPVMAGIIARKRFGRIANFFLMMFVFQATLTTIVFLHGPAKFQLKQLALLIPGVGIFPGVGWFSGVSPGGLAYPPLFALLAIGLHNARRV